MSLRSPRSFSLQPTENNTNVMSIPVRITNSLVDLFNFKHQCSISIAHASDLDRLPTPRNRYSAPTIYLDAPRPLSSVLDGVFFDSIKQGLFALGHGRVVDLSNIPFSWRIGIEDDRLLSGIIIPVALHQVSIDVHFYCTFDSRLIQIIFVRYN